MLAACATSHTRAAARHLYRPTRSPARLLNIPQVGDDTVSVAAAPTPGLEQGLPRIWGRDYHCGFKAEAGGR